jgi:hypothetical protein
MKLKIIFAKLIIKILIIKDFDNFLRFVQKKHQNFGAFLCSPSWTYFLKFDKIK